LIPSHLTGPLLGLVTVLVIFVVLLGLKGADGEWARSLRGRLGISYEKDALAHFVSLTNLQVLVFNNTVTAVVALGMLLIIVSGGIDLSVGSVVALVTVTIMVVYRLVIAASGSQVAASLLAVPAGIAVGGACGLVNGLVITQLRVAPFVATLGMLRIARGVAYWLAERKSIAFPGGQAPDWVDDLAEANPEHGLFNPGFWGLVVLAVLVALLLRTTVLGRYCYAIGSNEATARLCGVAISKNKIILYTLAGLLTGLGGVLQFAKVGSGEPGGSIGFELDVIAAVVIGGASLGGGQGTVSGVLMGVLILGILDNGVTQFHVPVEMQYVLIGCIIIANTALSRWRRRE
jgi:ribose transport system permease protein